MEDHTRWFIQNTFFFHFWNPLGMTSKTQPLIEQKYRVAKFLFLEKSSVTMVLKTWGGWILVLPNLQNILICSFLGSHFFMFILVLCNNMVGFWQCCLYIHSIYFKNKIYFWRDSFEFKEHSGKFGYNQV